MEIKTQAQRDSDEAWEPQILGFLCRWCSYAGADLAGTSRIKYPANVRIIKLPCSGRIDPLLILKALRLGYDGVIVSGCHPGDCHYQTGNYRARRRMGLTIKLLAYLGIAPERVQSAWCSAAEAGKFSQLAADVTKEVKKVGPNRLFHTDGQETAGQPAPRS